MAAHTGHSIGDHKISVTIHRKTTGDRLVSQWSLERWFETEDDLIAALRILVSDLVVPVSHIVDPRGNGHLDPDAVLERARDDVDDER
jgi:hypothetical protein